MIQRADALFWALAGLGLAACLAGGQWAAAAGLGLLALCHALTRKA